MNAIQVQRGTGAYKPRLGIDAIQAQRAVSMSAQGNALGQAWHAIESPNGAAPTTMKGS
jgi:hypothetical protein